ncbi:Transcription factor AP-1 [Gryllus bimaculatus]|nr:Transcription factor AP-1 [Gryllus bimaculatus]
MAGGYSDMHSQMHSQMQPHLVPQMLPQMHSSLQDIDYNNSHHTFEQAPAYGGPLQMADGAPMGMAGNADVLGEQQMGMGLGSGGWSGLLDELAAEHDTEGAPGVGGLDSEQERRRRERRRAMNRVAASRCRRRKLDRISQLESRVRSLAIDHQGLRATRAALRAQVR